MIVYSKIKNDFLEDVSNNVIHLKVHEAFRAKVGRSVGASEVASWRNSLLFMSQVLADQNIPADSKVSIEFNIPGSRKRIDMMVSGTNRSMQSSVVIIELKQWQDVSVTPMDGVVKTYLGGSIVDTPHPSYQAWSYAALMEGFNETVRSQKVSLKPCAYLHNLDIDTEIKAHHYSEYLAKAPCFISSDVGDLRKFISEHVCNGDSSDIIGQIEVSKLSPSKSLADSVSRMMAGNKEFVMIDDQKLVYETALSLIRTLPENKQGVLIVKGGPGTGKSIVAINLLAQLLSEGRYAQYVSKNAAPRAVYAAKLQGTLKKTNINAMFVGSGSFIDTPPNKIDVLIVDEAHRLNEKSGLYGNLGEHQVKELINAANFTIFFIDEDQQVTIKDVGSIDVIKKFADLAGATVRIEELASQFRCNGSDGYISFLDNALQIRSTANTFISKNEYDFRVFDSPEELHDEIRKLNKSENKARMVAGYCWDWISKKDSSAMDINIGNYKAKWNLAEDGGLWIISDDSVEEIGCVHTCQGLEVDYIGVIIGNDLIIRNLDVKTDAYARSNNDASIKGFKKMAKESPEAAKELAARIIKNTYRTLMTRGTKGCFIYSEDRETQEYFKSLIRNQ